MSKEVRRNHDTTRHANSMYIYVHANMSEKEDI